MYDIVIVGAGLFGSVIAQQCHEHGKKVLVVEKRKHIAGNCYTQNELGINVHKYGPHIFHTSNETVWNYVNRFTKFNNFSYRPRVNFKGKIYSFPINMMTFYQLWGTKTPDQARLRLDEARFKIEKPENFEQWVQSQVGDEIYQKFFYGYTKKQWMREPTELPVAIAKRLPIRMTYDDRYYNDRYEGIPIGGYTQMVEKMLEGCEVRCEVDFFDDKETLKRLGKKIVYSGKIDEYFDFCYGELEYRTLKFDERTYDGDFQGVAGINYTDVNVPYTRTIEHKHFEMLETAKTIVTYETPATWTKNSVPYYPINDDVNNKLYQMYRSLADCEANLVLGGRLGCYAYRDMHVVIAEALHKATKLFES